MESDDWVLAALIVEARDEVARVHQHANEITKAAKDRYLAVIAQARAQGLSHAQIAGILGVTRARAQQLANEAKNTPR